MRISPDFFVALSIIFPVTGYAHPAISADKPIINWQVSHFPPATFTREPSRGEGYADRALSYVIASLPQFDHRIEVINLARFLYRAKEGQDTVCNAALLRSPDREEILHFSGPAYETLSNRLITQEAFAPQFTLLATGEHMVSLDALRRRGDLIVGINQNRTFGPLLDEFLDIQSDQRRSYEASTTATAIRMLAAGRIHYSFGSIVEANFHLKDLDGTPPVKLVSFGIEGIPPLQTGYFACSRTKDGEAAITALDPILKTRAYRESWESTYLRWLDDQGRADYFALTRP